MRLSVEAVSLYLIFVDLASRPAPLTRSACEALWNGRPEALPEAIAELELHNIVEVCEDRFALRPDPDWREGATA
jgi:hypothetical protein